MKEIEMMNGARVIVEVCAGVKPDENLVIVTDTNKLTVAKVLAAAANERGAEVTIAMMTPRKMNGEEPTKPIVEAMCAADVILTPTTCSIGHSSATSRARKAGARVLLLSAFTEDMLISGAIEADFMSASIPSRRLARRLGEARDAEITTPMGTNIKLDLTGRTGNSEDGIVREPGTWSAPVIEANTSPVEGSAEGTIVIDGAIGGVMYLSEPLRIAVEKGRITNVEGGVGAKTLAKILKDAKDPNAYNIAEIGFGMNPKSRFGVGNWIEDEGAMGTGHFGIGDSILLGGNVNAKIHYDLIYHKPTLKLDAEMIMKEGQLTI